MNESILKALIKLFALVSDVKTKEEISSGEREILRAFLKSHLNQEQVQQYVKQFDYYIEYYHASPDRYRSQEHNYDEVINDNVKDICKQINDGLYQKQRFFILMQLIEFIAFGAEVTNSEIYLLELVSANFSINNKEFNNLKNFVFNSTEDTSIHDKLLIVNNEKEYTHPFHICRENLDGIIKVLFIESADVFFLKYSSADLFLNNNIVIAGRTYIINQGASIRNHKINPVYYSDISAGFNGGGILSQISIEANSVEFLYPDSDNGVHDFDFYAKSGELIAVLGGSGVGKTTMLNVLCGSLIPEKGKVLINGYDIAVDNSELEGLIGFVSQDNLLIEELSVYQNLFYNAKLCLGHLSENEIEQKVDDLLISLLLSEIKDLKVGNELNKYISGGQRKRLNIALELIREPFILFVDEPTSGLSSADSEMVMDLLKEQAIKGKIVIVNIHQPSSDIYKMFNQVYVLDIGGYVIYSGNPLDALEYFKRKSNYVNAQERECKRCGNTNAEQILQIIGARTVDELGMITRMRKVTPKQWCELFEKNRERRKKEVVLKTEVPKKKNIIPNVLKQFSTFFSRDLISKLTNRQYIIINAIQAPLLAIIIGYFTKFISGDSGDSSKYLFSENVNLSVYLFMCVVVSIFMGLTLSASELIKDRKIRKRESFLKLSRLAYLNSKIVIVFGISALQTFLLVSMGNYILGVDSLFINYWWLLFSTACFSNMLGLNISAGLNSVVTIYIMIPLMLVPQLLFSGVVVSFDKMHKNITSELFVPFIGDLMVSRWAYEALAVNQFINNDYEKHFFDSEKEMSNAAFVFNFLVPELKQKAHFAINNKTNRDKKVKVQNELEIIRNEINRLKIIHPSLKVDFSNDLYIEKYNGSVAEKVNAFLGEINNYYINKHKDYSNTRDNQMYKLINELGGKSTVQKLYNNSYNVGLADLLKNKDEVYKVVEINKRLYQKSDPVYRDSESILGRAHFYAPTKKLGNYRFNTFGFNSIVIWIMIFILYIALYADWLRKINSRFERKKEK